MERFSFNLLALNNNSDKGYCSGIYIYIYIYVCVCVCVNISNVRYGLRTRHYQGKNGLEDVIGKCVKIWKI